VERAKRSIASSQSRITQAKAALDQARTQLTHTTIRAPFDAFVLRRQVEVGSGVAGVSQSASGGSILMTLGDARESSLFARATAADARRLKPGQVARVRLDSDATQQLPAVVVSVSTAGDVDPQSRLTTFPVVIALKTQPSGGWVNVPAQAEIVLSSTVDSVTIPEWCVRTDSSGRSSIQVQGAAGNRWRVVEVGVVQKDRIQIRSGLDKGQTVVCRARP
jgi:multidrug efflux pump subunit AcrA (membrane-fusion protein)